MKASTMTTICQFPSSETAVYQSQLANTTGAYILHGLWSHRIYAGQSRQESTSYQGLLGRISTHEKLRYRNNHNPYSFLQREPVDVLLVSFDSQQFLGHKGVQMETALIQALANSSHAPLLLNKQLPKPLGSPLLFEECSQLLDTLAQRIPEDAAYQRVLDHTLVHALRLGLDRATLSRIREVLLPLLQGNYALQRQFIQNIVSSFRTHVAPLV